VDEAFADGRIAPAASLVRPCWSHPLPIAPTYWHLPAPPPPDVRARLSERGPIITQILFNRGLADPEDVAEFFGLRARPTDPFLMRGVGETVERLRTAIQRHQVVAVYVISMPTASARRRCWCKPCGRSGPMSSPISPTAWMRATG